MNARSILDAIDLITQVETALRNCPRFKQAEKKIVIIDAESVIDAADLLVQARQIVKDIFQLQSERKAR